ncbi:uncharacterized protein BDR25DRAFT_353010 [Lindgomyces ingoldianus]|uniref:Uncharacterized protein n=1 Tax=Lindgomyces ingoldianus TaxID=673940 RepID=A0ACB6R2F4_9PLEO|nr:uncharacterized protein BDR25DRAFT_353010 [Lindgomyces ingoldianus]KAF2472692.1 hypothetical protein BDR25DRAFT_353010 [Lindgomyces ingoldianus]
MTRLGFPARNLGSILTTSKLLNSVNVTLSILRIRKLCLVYCVDVNVLTATTDFHIPLTKLHSRLPSINDAWQPIRTRNLTGRARESVSKLRSLLQVGSSAAPAGLQTGAMRPMRGVSDANPADASPSRTDYRTLGAHYVSAASLSSELANILSSSESSLDLRRVITMNGGPVASKAIHISNRHFVEDASTDLPANVTRFFIDYECLGLIEGTIRIKRFFLSWYLSLSAPSFNHILFLIRTKTHSATSPSNQSKLLVVNEASMVSACQAWNGPNLKPGRRMRVEQYVRRRWNGLEYLATYLLVENDTKIGLEDRPAARGLQRGFVEVGEPQEDQAINISFADENSTEMSPRYVGEAYIVVDSSTCLLSAHYRSLPVTLDLCSGNVVDAFHIGIQRATVSTVGLAVHLVLFQNGNRLPVPLAIILMQQSHYVFHNIRNSMYRCKPMMSYNRDREEVFEESSKIVKQVRRFISGGDPRISIVGQRRSSIHSCPNPAEKEHQAARYWEEKLVGFTRRKQLPISSPHWDFRRVGMAPGPGTHTQRCPRQHARGGKALISLFVLRPCLAMQLTECDPCLLANTMMQSSSPADDRPFAQHCSGLYPKPGHIALRSEGSRTGTKATHFRQRLGEFGAVWSLCCLILGFSLFSLKQEAYPCSRLPG